MKFQFKKYNEPDNFLGILIFARLNKWQLHKAKTLARKRCETDHKRRYVVEIFGTYAVVSSTDIARANRGAGRKPKVQINNLLQDALYIADQNNLQTKN